MQRGRWRHRYKTSVPSQHRTWTTASNQNRRIQPEPLHPTRTAAVPGNEHRERQLRWGTSIIQHWTAAPHPQQLCPHCAVQDGGDLSASSWRDPPHYELALSISKDVELGLKGVEAAPFSSAETAVTAQPYGCFNNAPPQNLGPQRPRVQQHCVLRVGSEPAAAAAAPRSIPALQGRGGRFTPHLHPRVGEDPRSLCTVVP